MGWGGDSWHRHRQDPGVRGTQTWWLRSSRQPLPVLNLHFSGQPLLGFVEEQRELGRRTLKEIDMDFKHMVS